MSNLFFRAMCILTGWFDHDISPGRLKSERQKRVIGQDRHGVTEARPPWRPFKRQVQLVHM